MKETRFETTNGLPLAIVGGHAWLVNAPYRHAALSSFPIPPVSSSDASDRNLRSHSRIS